MTDAGHPVVGVDLSPNMLELAHQRLGARVAVGDVDDAPDSRPAACRTWWPCGSSSSSGASRPTLDDARRVLSLGGRLVVIPSRGHYCPDDIDAVSVDFQAEIRGGRQDDPKSSSLRARRRGFACSNDSRPTTQEFDESPAEIIRRIETRGYGILLDLGDDDWQRVVVPALDALRSLPDQDRPAPQIDPQRRARVRSGLTRARSRSPARCARCASATASTR